MKKTKQIAPVFILGNPRSGTTLLRLTLTNHPKIVIAPESSFLIWWYDKYKDWNKKSNDTTQLDLFLADLLSSKKIEHWSLNKEKLKARLQERRAANYADLCKEIYLEYAGYSQKKITYWGDKNNYYVNCPKQLYELYPNALFIHIIRDVRDVFCSYKDMSKIDESTSYVPKLPKTTKEIGHEWGKNNNKVLSFFRTLDKNQFVSIRYEDLVSNTESTLSKLCDFLSLNFHENMLDYWRTENSYFFEPKNYKAWKNLNFQRIDTSRIGRYKLELSNEELDHLNDFNKELLTQYNYL